MTRSHVSSLRGAAWSGAGLFLLTLLLYLPSVRNGFAYDDVTIIMVDPRVADPDVGGILRQPYWQDSISALYRPLTTASFAADWQISGGRPSWFHLVNTLWHAAATVLLFALLLRITGHRAAALLGALIFAVHPVHVEAVANVVGRAELIAATFAFTALLLWCAPRRISRSASGVLLLCVLFAAALTSKESAAVLPGLIAATDVARGRLRPGTVRRWLAVAVRPLAATGLVLALFLVARQAVIGDVAPDSLDATIEVLASPLHRFFTALTAWPHYLRLLFFPRVLLADYGPGITWPALALEPRVLFGMLLLALSTLGALLAWLRGKRLTAAALIWFFLAVLPVSNFIIPIGVLIAERTLYMPSVALSIGAAGVALYVARAFARPLRLSLAAGAAVVVLLFASRTLARIPVWQDTRTVFTALIEDRPDSYKAQWHFARLAAAEGDMQEALARYSTALQIWPHRQRLVREAALQASAAGERDWSLQLVQHGLTRWPDDIALRRLQAGALLDAGDYAEARRHIDEGLRWQPGDSLLLRMRDAARIGASQ